MQHDETHNDLTTVRNVQTKCSIVSPLKRTVRDCQLTGAVLRSQEQFERGWYTTAQATWWWHCSGVRNFRIIWMLAGLILMWYGAGGENYPGRRNWRACTPTTVRSVVKTLQVCPTLRLPEQDIRGYWKLQDNYSSKLFTKNIEGETLIQLRLLRHDHREEVCVIRSM